ncbi:unnamed protein product [Dibothriocephalus latus]|uniref:sn-1-specific diacylglycerol lipase ABHD11 n=1 Tax=Dibothriocephalus latus TaxID=60516 RepID=A0A3P6SUX9_DIBLA|nr:unnamed protein product [Dibothriocephalus latus]
MDAHGIWPPLLDITDSYFSNRDQALALAYAAYTLQTAKFQQPIIILHGLLGNKRNWRSFANDLIRNNFGQIFCVDLRNHGDSPHSQDFNYLTMADDLVRFIHDRQLSNVSLIGHSMGGKVAMVTALREPSLVNRLVVVDIAPIFSANVSGIDKCISLMKEVNLKTRFAQANGDVSVLRLKLMREWAEENLAPSLLSFILSNLRDRDGKPIWKVNVNAVAENLDEIMGFPYTLDDTISYNGPSRFIAGQRSSHIKPETMNEVNHFFPRAERIEIPNAGHWVHTDAPGPLCDAISSFLR